MAATDHVRSIQERLAGVLARVLRRFFAEQAARVVARYLAGLTDLLPDGERVLLERIVEPRVLTIVLAVSSLAGDLVGEAPLQERDPAVLRILAEAANRVRGIDAATRRAIRETLRQGAERGYAPEQIARGVPADGYRGLRAVVREVYRGRAETIARTEMAYAAQEAAHDRYRAAGVQRVRITDGPGCGWTSHDDPDRANGSTRALWEAQMHPLSHPNCRRVSMPILERR